MLKIFLKELIGESIKPYLQSSDKAGADHAGLFHLQESLKALLPLKPTLLRSLYQLSK